MEVNSSQGVQVVDPEVRAYVYSLVTAVSFQILKLYLSVD
jgi:hypothetical protein